MHSVKLISVLLISLSLLSDSLGNVVISERSQPDVKHGDSYTIQSVVDESVVKYLQIDFSCMKLIRCVNSFVIKTIHI